MKNAITQRGLVALVLTAALVVPAVGVIAGPKAKKEKLDRKLERLREQLAEDSNKMEVKSARLDALDRNVRELQKEIARIDHKIAQIETKVGDQQSRIDDVRALAQEVRTSAVEQAVSLYKSGSTNVLGALLDSETLAELDTRVEMLGIAAEEKTGALIRYGRLQLRIRGEEQELFDLKDDLSAELDNKKLLADEMRARKAELGELIGQLRLEVHRGEREVAATEAESAALAQDIVNAQAKSEVKALGTSRTGFIWPLNGNVTSYYGPRWGRMHSGIDIDGYTGQPEVAAKEGKVILAEYYSGYGNAVVIDHGGGYSTLYGHMSTQAVVEGQYVEQGDVIGYVGCTGSCTGDHLHFEVRISGDPVDPMPYLP